MTKKKKIPSQATSAGSSKKRKEKGKTDPRTPMQRVKVVGPSGKVRLEWRPW